MSWKTRIDCMKLLFIFHTTGVIRKLAQIPGYISSMSSPLIGRLLLDGSCFVALRVHALGE